MRLRWRRRADLGLTTRASERDDEAFAEELLDEGREELQRADSKASILLSAAGLVAGALVAAAAAGEWNPTKIDSAWAQGLFWIGIAAGAIGVCLLGSAVMPRIHNPGRKESLAYFGHVVQFRERGFTFSTRERRSRVSKGKTELRAAIVSASAGRFDRVVDQVWVISHIVHRKYRLIRWALMSLLVAALLCFGALALGSLES